MSRSVRPLLVLSLLSLVAVFACRDNTSPGSELVVGTLTSVQVVSQYGEVRLLIGDLVSRPEHNNISRLYLLANANTPISIQRAGQPAVKGSISELMMGARVTATVGRIVLDSDPQQFGALTIASEQ